MPFVGRLVHPTAEPRVAMPRLRFTQPSCATVSEGCCPSVGALLTVNCPSDAKKRWSLVEHHSPAFSLHPALSGGCPSAGGQLTVGCLRAKASNAGRGTSSTTIRCHQPQRHGKFYARKPFPGCSSQLRVSLAESRKRKVHTSLPWLPEYGRRLTLRST
jgi:hypothetical protein